MPRSSASSRISSSACHVVGPQRAVLGERRVVPGLVLRVALGAAALEIERDRKQPVPPPFGHRGDELARVALRVPRLRVRIGPSRRASPGSGRRRSPAPCASWAAGLPACGPRQTTPFSVGWPLMRKLSAWIATVVLRPAGTSFSSGRRSKCDDRGQGGQDGQGRSKVHRPHGGAILPHLAATNRLPGAFSTASQLRILLRPAVVPRRHRRRILPQPPPGSPGL